MKDLEVAIAQYYYKVLENGRNIICILYTKTLTLVDTELNNRYPGRQSTIAHYYKEVMVYLEKGENAENR